jgi:Sec-independent protein translocase protein TatA
MVRIGLPELIIILIVMVVIFRFDALLDMAKGLVNALRNFRKATQEDPDKPDKKIPDRTSAPDDKNNPRT